MYGSEDLENFCFQYQTEALFKGISVEQFCSRNKVPCNIFYKWYKDICNKLVEVKVDGLPSSVQEKPKEERPSQAPHRWKQRLFRSYPRGIVHDQWSSYHAE